MLQITLRDYLMSRDMVFPEDYNETIEKNASELVMIVNGVLAELAAKGFKLVASTKTGTLVSSGWRPRQYNERIRGAAPNSKHITAQAVDIYDPKGEIGKFLAANIPVLERWKVFMENPSRTPTWVHLQSVPPRSGNRVFNP